MDKQERERQLKCDFSNYERTVSIVNAIEGHLRRYYKDLIVYFDRYPAIVVCGGPGFLVGVEG
jgi:hypothetical protein